MKPIQLTIFPDAVKEEEYHVNFKELQEIVQFFMNDIFENDGKTSISVGTYQTFVHFVADQPQKYFMFTGFIHGLQRRTKV